MYLHDERIFSMSTFAVKADIKVLTTSKKEKKRILLSKAENVQVTSANGSLGWTPFIHILEGNLNIHHTNAGQQALIRVSYRY